MIIFLKLRTIVLGFVLSGAVALAAAAQESETPEADQSDQNFSLDEATDNFVDDAGKVGDKAEEVGDDIADEAEDTYDSTKKVIQDATE